MSKSFIQNLLLLAVTLVIALGTIELGARLLMQPSEVGSGLLFGRDLPPWRLIETSGLPHYDPAAWHGSLVVDGRKISHGDLHGIFRPDPVLAFTYQEGVKSANDWWRSNNMGARADYDVDSAVPPGRSRVLVFGESFAQGSRLPQGQAWPNMIDNDHAEFEVLNFAVDGYSMAQAFLRYQQVRPLLDYDAVVLMFVPEADLWRDINTVRRLAEPRWPSPIVQPRFILKDGDLALVPPLYADPFDVYRLNAHGLSPELRSHLRRYDRFYFPREHEPSALRDTSVLYRLIAHARGRHKRRVLRAAALEISEEAIQVSKAMFSAWRDLVAADGARFMLAILPVEYKWREARHQPQWQALVSAICPSSNECVDLLDTLQHVPIAEYDYAHDGAHFGPRTNARIAAAIIAALGSQLPDREALD